MSRRTPPPTPLTSSAQVPRYRDRILDSKRHDPYQVAGKYRDSSRCPDCGAVYHAGRWQWSTGGVETHGTVCPACHRIRDALPAGSLVLEGPFVSAHRDALLAIVNAEAERERREHPLHRIMRIDEQGERIEVSTTDIHLPQRIGEALKHAQRGELTVRYGEDEYSVRVRWRR